MQTAVANRFRLSPQQNRLWALSQRDQSTTYRTLCKILIEGDVDSARLEAALKSVAQRHEIFRTTFEPSAADADAAQVIHDDDCLSSINIDLSGLSRAEQDFCAAALVEDANRLSIDLVHGPLIRALVVRVSPSVHLLILSASSLCADKTTMKNLTEEIARTYESLSQSDAAFDDPAQYADLAEWQNELLESKDTEFGTRYWKEIDLSAVRSFDEGSRFDPRRFSFEIDHSLTKKIKAVADEKGISDFAYLLACWHILLSRQTEQASITSGVAFDGRRSEEVMTALGLFAKHLPVKIDFQQRAAFAEVIKQAERAIEDARKWQEFFSWEVSKDQSTTPGFFPFCFEFDNQTPVYKTKDATYSLFVHSDYFDRFEIKLCCSASPDSLGFELQYDASIVNITRIERIADQFQTLLASSAANPDALAGQLEILSERERQRIINESNNGRKNYPVDKCIQEIFERRAEQWPENVAITFGDQSMSYSQLNRRANQLAAFLRKRDVGPDTRVGVYLEPSLEMFVALLGILKAGGAYLPIDRGNPGQRIAFMLKDAEVSVLLSSSEMAASLPETTANLIRLDADWETISCESEANIFSGAQPENLAYVIYTSGSTGEPKGAQVTHENVGRLLDATSQWFGFDENDTWTMFHSYAFDFSVWEIWGALLHGGRVVAVPYPVTRAPEQFRELLHKEKVTVLNMTPSAFRQLVSAEENADQSKQLSLRFVIFGGEAIDLASLKPWFERYGDRKPQLVNMYGITETTVHVTYHPLTINDLDDAQSNPIGIPIPDLQTFVLDQHLNPVPVGVPGELFVGGAGLARGYLNRSDLTATRFIPNHLGHVAGERLYRSGDQARLRQDGSLEYLGRIDQQVKIRGFRMELREIEAAISQHPAIRETVVASFDRESGDKRLICYFVSSDDSLGVSEIRRHLKERLPEYMIPSRFMRLGSLPLTINGKIDKKALPSASEWRPDSNEQYVAPRTPLETGLAQIWGNFLGIERIGIHDHFFDLGGHSLLATQIVYGVRDTYGIEIPLAWFFTEAPTVAGLADAIEQYQIKEAEDAEIAAALEEMMDLSDDEVKALLAS